TAELYKNSAMDMGERHSRRELFPFGADDLLVRGLIEVGDKHMDGDGSEVVEGQRLYLQAERIARRSGLRTSSARARFALGKLHLSIQYFEQADDDFKRALKLEFPNEEISDQSIALWRTKLGDEDYDSALLRFKKEFLRWR